MAVKKSVSKSRVDDHPAKSKSKARRKPSKEKGAARSGQKPADDDGALPVNTGALELPQGLNEEEEETNGFLSFDPVVLVILCFSAIFILVIAYVIWNGWEPPTP